MNLTVVVDGGGSGCRLGAYDAKGTLCATAKDGPASLSLGEEQAWLHISRGLATLAKQLGKPDDWQPSRMCLGLAGSLQQSRRQRFLSYIPSPIETVLVTDGHAQLLGACGGHPGACLSVGTGSVLHWLDKDGHFNMAGGWGFPMGDEGSGAWLGAQLINAYLWHRDRPNPRDKNSPLFESLEDRIGREISDVQVWSTSTRSTELASLAPIIVSAAKEGDVLAHSLLEKGVVQCERLLSLVPDSLPIFLVGGLGNTYLKRFNKQLRARCQTPHGDALSGLYALSKSEQHTAPSSDQRGEK